MVCVESVYFSMRDFYISRNAFWSSGLYSLICFMFMYWYNVLWYVLVVVQPSIITLSETWWDCFIYQKVILKIVFLNLSIIINTTVQVCRSGMQRHHMLGLLFSRVILIMLSIVSVVKIDYKVGY